MSSSKASPLCVVIELGYQDLMADKVTILTCMHNIYIPRNFPPQGY